MDKLVDELLEVIPKCHDLSITEVELVGAMQALTGKVSYANVTGLRDALHKIVHRDREKRPFMARLKVLFIAGWQSLARLFSRRKIQ